MYSAMHLGAHVWTDSSKDWTDEFQTSFFPLQISALLLMAVDSGFQMGEINYTRVNNINSRCRSIVESELC